jgi:hypothetical protein
MTRVRVPVDPRERRMKPLRREAIISTVAGGPAKGPKLSRREPRPPSTLSWRAREARHYEKVSPKATQARELTEAAVRSNHDSVMKTIPSDDDERRCRSAARGLSIIDFPYQEGR